MGRKGTAAVVDLPPEVLAEARYAATMPPFNRYIPHTPFPQQETFLRLDCLEAFYGGAAGGGKSDALLMAALQYVEEPGYAAILFRKTYQDLALQGALMDRAREWLLGTDAKWDSVNKRWNFPSGASISFGYLDSEDDKFRYKSAQFHFCGMDEVSHFSVTQYLYLFSRLRRARDSIVPIRMRCASNPEGPGLEWVKERFVDPGDPTRPFVRSTYKDNIHIDQEGYRQSLSHLDPITRARLEAGDWYATEIGKKFKRQWFKIVDDFPRNCPMVRYYDLATGKEDGDEAVGTLTTAKNGQVWIVDQDCFRESAFQTELRVKQNAVQDGYDTFVFIEQEPGSEGELLIDHYVRNVLPGYACEGDRATGDKFLRMNPMASAAEAGNVFLVKGKWNKGFLDQSELIGTSACKHDDRIDSACGAFRKVHEFADIYIGRLSGWNQ